MMKILFTTTFALGALCIVEINQPAHANLSENISANIHLARGREGVHRGEHNRAAVNRGDRGAGDRAPGSRGTNDAGHTSNFPTSETPVERTLGESNAVHDRTLKNNRNRGDGWGSNYGTCVTVDAKGNCIPSETTGTTTTIN